MGFRLQFQFIFTEKDVQVSEDFISILNAIKTDRPDLKVYHGGMGGAPQKAADRPKPMKVINNVVESVSDFFFANKLFYQ